MNRMLQLFLACVLAISPAFGHEPLNIKPLVERTVDSLPDGTLYWRIENFSDIAAATAAAGPWSLVAEAAGKVLALHVDGRSQSERYGRESRGGGADPSGRRDQVPPSHQPGNGCARQPDPGTHPSRLGSVLRAARRAEHSRPPPTRCVCRVGQAEAGRGAGVPMQVSSTGDADLSALVMFVVDADRSVFVRQRLCRETHRHPRAQSFHRWRRKSMKCGASPPSWMVDEVRGCPCRIPGTCVEAARELQVLGRWCG
jgi:hypothetical protein